MKILFISPVSPLPLTSGGRVRVYNLLKNLKKKHDITLFTYLRPGEEKVIKDLKRNFSKVITVKRRPIWSITNLVFASLLPLPLLCCSYLSWQGRKKLKKELKKGYDLVHLETFYLLPLLFGLKKPSIILTEHNIEYLVYKNYIKNAPFFLRPLMEWDVLKLKLTEQYCWKKVNSVIAVSSQDSKIIESRIGRNVAVVPNGIEPKFFEKLKAKQKEAPNTVLFIGYFRWLPNKEGALWLLRDIWPLLKQKNANLKLLMVGQEAQNKIKKLCKKDKQIELKSDVQDIRDAFRVADVLIAPLKSGRGTRYKILEAMAAGVPVVTTAVGIQGVKAKWGKDVLIGQNTEQLADKTIKILSDKALSSQIITSAQKLVFQNYSWSKITTALTRAYEKTLL